MLPRLAPLVVASRRNTVQRKNGQPNRSNTTNVAPEHIGSSVQGIASHFQVESLEDWYNIKEPALRQQFGINLANLVDKLKEEYGDHEWQEWRFAHVPLDFWKSQSNQERFFNHIISFHKMTNLDGFYKLKLRDIAALGGATLMAQFYSNSLPRALRSIFPTHDWKEWRFARAPPDYWSSQSNVRRFFDDYRATKQLNDVSDMYNVTFFEIVDAGGGAILQQYEGLLEALQAAYPEHQWLPWKFKNVPRGDYWKNVENQAKFFEWLGNELKFKELNDWYRITAKEVRSNNGNTLLQRYFKGSVISALKELYPYHEWKEWKFSHLKLLVGFWSSMENRKRFVKSLAEEFKILSLDQWYSVSNADIVAAGGKTLLEHFDGYVGALIHEAVPEVDKYGWAAQIPSGYWSKLYVKDSELARKELTSFLSSVSSKPPLSIHQAQDWYRVDATTLVSSGVSRAVDSFGGLIQALEIVYPDFSWDPKAFSFKGKASVQRSLKETLSSLFGAASVKENAVVHGFEADLFVPNYSLAIELQGVQHYRDTRRPTESKKQQESDVAKAAELLSNGITLVTIPFDGSIDVSNLDSVTNLLLTHRGDLPLQRKTEQETKTKHPIGYWGNQTHQRQFLEEVGKKLELSSLADWYKVPREVIRKNGGTALLKRYRGSHVSMLRAVFSEHKWLPWKFSATRSGFWSDMKNQRWFFDELRNEMGLESIKDLYSVSLDDVVRAGGSGLITNYYNSSVAAAIQAAYPEHTWEPWRFEALPIRFWQDLSNQRKYFDGFMADKRMAKLDEWYHTKSKDVTTHGGGGLMRGIYSNSIYTALQTVYPEHCWLPWKFNTVPMGFWQKEGNQRWFLEWLCSELQLTTPTEKRTLTAEAIMKHGGAGLLAEHDGSARQVLQAIYGQLD